MDLKDLSDFDSILILSSRFEGRTNEQHYVDIINSGGCASYVGLLSRGRQELWLNRDQGCVQEYIVVHELLHALGFHHEQTRPDRDSYITIHWDNIKVIV